MRSKAISGILLLALILSACSLTSSGNAPTTGGGNSGSENAVKVSISNFKFDPQTVTIKVGQTVTWTNSDTAAHTVTADDNSWTSEKINTGDSFSKTFDKAGTYPYHCSIHLEMKGTVIVQP